MLRGPHPRLFHSQNGVDPTWTYGLLSTVSVRPSFLSASTPEPVTSLYVDPGGWMSPIAWLISGRSLSARSFWKSAVLIPREKGFASYVGSLTMARISPVCGFMTTIAPRLRSEEHTSELQSRQY